MKKVYRNKSGLNPKIAFDKYHTPDDLAKQCVEILLNYIGDHSQFSFLDPCAGNGEFSNLIENCDAYDIDPGNTFIKKADFLKLELSYKKNRIVFGNPPYGSRLNTAVLFFKKAVSIGDYVAFLLPLSQFKNNNMFYEFDLVHSVKLGKHQFSGTPIDCVFNIYKRPESGILHSRPLSKEYRKKLKDITISEVRLKNKKVLDYDIRICAWGSVGKPILDGEHYAKELYIKINREEIRDIVMSLIESADWRQMYSMNGVYNLAQWHVIKYLKDNITDLA